MRLPRAMIAAPGSGSGKTIITCGLLESLRRKGMDVRSYKCGPDYIDPMFHRRVIGVPGGNLDTFFSSDEEIREMVSRADCEAVVIEGVMGIYDGISGAERCGSCYDTARITETPVILVTDVKGMGQTMLSVIKGILADDRECLIRGIVLNRISPGYFRTIGPLMREMLEEISAGRDCDVKLIGGIPDSKDIQLESRHLGLNMPDEIDGLKDQVAKAADLIEEYLDMDSLIGIMNGAPELRVPQPEKDVTGVKAAGDTELTIAVARDEAFCFYYEENLRMLRGAGIKTVEFSPLHDCAVPDEADGLLLGGGYPELYADELSSNSSMLASITAAIESGMPSLAECGGFMYLLETLEDMQDAKWRMAGVIRGSSHNTGKLARFGYVTISGKKHLCTSDSLLTGLSVKGHEFHYYDSDNNGSNAIAVKPGSGRTWECIHAGDDHIWGYPHLYYPSCPELVRRFAGAMQSYRTLRCAKDDR